MTTIAFAGAVLGAGFLFGRPAKPTAQPSPSASATAAVAGSPADGTTIVVPSAPAGVAPVVIGGRSNPAPVNPVVAGSAVPSPATSPPPRPTVTKVTTTRTTTAGAGRPIVSHSSGRCIDVPDAGGDGTPLHIWDCAGSRQQSWTFTGGTVQALGLCLDIAGADNRDGAVIQVARCNGGWAQRWTLNSSHDLANTVTGQCVDIAGNGSANGSRLQLWTCSGTSNQKWS